MERQISRKDAALHRIAFNGACILVRVSVIMMDGIAKGGKV